MTTTDWQLIRDVLAAAVDACEAAEGLNLRPEDRALTTNTGASVWDVLMSAWTYPENARYAVIRARHDVGDDAPYVPELARVLTGVAGLCAEVVGARDLATASVARDGEARPSIRAWLEGVAAWYRGQMVPQLQFAAASRAVSISDETTPTEPTSASST